jgi:hypothetical protein
MQLAKTDDSQVNQVLLQFASLNGTNKTRFLSQLNAFLLASPQQQRRLTQQWQPSEPQPPLAPQPPG